VEQPRVVSLDKIFICVQSAEASAYQVKVVNQKYFTSFTGSELFSGITNRILPSISRPPVNWFLHWCFEDCKQRLSMIAQGGRHSKVGRKTDTGSSQPTASQEQREISVEDEMLTIGHR
jgi:hypothetical protein